MGAKILTLWEEMGGTPETLADYVRARYGPAPLSRQSQYALLAALRVRAARKRARLEQGAANMKAGVRL